MVRPLVSHIHKEEGRLDHTLLYDHLSSVGDRCASLIAKLRQHFHLAIAIDDLIDAAFITGVCHDFAKSKRQFQNYIWGGPSRDKNHAMLSSIFTFIVASDRFQEKSLPTSLLPFICAYAVNRHHGLLTNIDGEEGAFAQHKLEVEYEIGKDSIDERVWSFNFVCSLTNLKIQYGNYKSTLLSVDLVRLAQETNSFARWLRQKSEKPDSTDEWLFDLYFALFLTISVLTESDQACVIGASEPEEVQTIDPKKVKLYAFSQQKAAPKMQELRERAWEEVERFTCGNDLPSARLTLPTGLGKTLMGLYAAGKLQQDSTAPIIYALPYLSIIDQVSKTSQAALDTGVYKIIQHHSLSFPQGGEDEKANFEQARFSLEQWNADLVVTTFDQLLYSFLSAERGFIHRFYRLPGSVLVLDEVQSIPARLIPAVDAFLQSLQKKLSVKILYMTATQPPFLKNAVSMLKREEEFFTPLKRTKLRLNIQNSTPFTEYLDDLSEWMKKRKGKSILFVANTIRSSLILFEHLSKLRDEQFKDLDLIYLSGNVVPVQRLNRINRIKKSLEDLRSKFTTKSKPWLVVVSTQCVEAGVDIDMDEVVRDFAPWDSLMQVCGRANRAAKNRVANVWIYRWIDDIGGSGREFNQYIYDPILINATASVIGGRKTIPEPQYSRIHRAYTELLEQILSTNEAQEILKSALSWRFDEIGNFQKLFRGVDSWKVSLLCEADTTSENLRDICTLIWDKDGPQIEEAQNRLIELCREQELFAPIQQFLRVTSQQIVGLTHQIKSGDKKKARHELMRLIQPMLQAYTVSISVKRLQDFPVGRISDDFRFLPRENYDAEKGCLAAASGDIRSNIL
jgi:CRISPR-associated endonuclease/helicase Cas3